MTCDSQIEYRSTVILPALKDVPEVIILAFKENESNLGEMGHVLPQRNQYSHDHTLVHHEGVGMQHIN